MRELPAIVTALMFRLGLHRVWRRIPRRLRRRVVDRLVRLPLRDEHDERPVGAGAPYTVLGFARSHASLGWTMRAIVGELENDGHACRIIDVSDRFGSTQKAAPAPVSLPAEPGTLVVCVNPNQVAYALAGLPKSFLERQRLVGCFVWELERVPRNWLPAIALMDEIWAPTEFVASAMLRAAPETHVEVRPYALRLPRDISPERPRWKLDPAAFVVLVAGNARSGIARKNMGAAIAAFRQAFPDPAAACAQLVVKLHDAHLASAQATAMLAELRAPDTIFIEDDLDDADTWRLVASCDVVLSLHRSEGYGLMLRQGLMLGRKVIATGWSGNVEFMRDDPNASLVDCTLVPVDDPEGIYDDAAGLVWAEPDTGHAASILRELERTRRDDR